MGSHMFNHNIKTLMQHLQVLSSTNEAIQMISNQTNIVC